jgi:Protein of unknown function (DUF3551)
MMPGTAAMKLLTPTIGALMAAAVASLPAGAQNYPWCANFADGAGVNCGFPTYEQCMATSVGSGGIAHRTMSTSPPLRPRRPAAINRTSIIPAKIPDDR